MALAKEWRLLSMFSSFLGIEAIRIDTSAFPSRKMDESRRN